MSYIEPKIYTFTAGADLSSYKNRFVKFGADYETVAICGANERAIGVLMNAPESGERAEVAVIGGGAKLEIDEAVALGKLITSKALGLGEVADAGGEWCAAIAMQDGVQGDVISVNLIGMQAQASDA
jgi:hypothetical protein